MNDNIKNKINNTLQSLNGLTPAEPKPFLLTRVHALISKEAGQENSTWSQVATFIKRPAVATFAVLLVVAVNVAAFTGSGFFATKNSPAKRVASTSRYDFSINVSGIYDIENQEP